MWKNFRDTELFFFRVLRITAEFLEVTRISFDTYQQRCIVQTQENHNKMAYAFRREVNVKNHRDTVWDTRKNIIYAQPCFGSLCTFMLPIEGVVGVSLL